MSTIETVVAATLARAERVACGVEALAPRLGPILAAPPADLGTLPLDDQIATVAYLKRFEQLQDLFVRLTRAVMSWEGLDTRAMTLRDLGDALEKAALLEAAPDWMAAARLRNRLAHEYPVEEPEQVARLIETALHLPFLTRLLASIRQHLVRRGFFDD